MNLQFQHPLPDSESVFQLQIPAWEELTAQSRSGSAFLTPADVMVVAPLRGDEADFKKGLDSGKK